jgi:hypothetical protein
VAGMGPAGLRRLNKTIYQTEGGAFAYHEVHPRNNVLFGVICFCAPEPTIARVGVQLLRQYQVCAP